MTVFWIIASVVVFVAIVFAVVMTSGIRLTGKQIDEDPSVRDRVDPDQRDEDFPVSVDY